MHAGELDRKISIGALVEGQDTAGGHTETWTERVAVWAKYEPVRGGERFLSAARTADAEAKFTIRYLAVDEAERIEFGGDTYDILNVAHLGREAWTEIIAKRSSS